MCDIQNTHAHGITRTHACEQDARANISMTRCICPYSTADESSLDYHSLTWHLVFVLAGCWAKLVLRFRFWSRCLCLWRPRIWFIRRKYEYALSFCLISTFCMCFVLDYYQWSFFGKSVRQLLVLSWCKSASNCERKGHVFGTLAHSWRITSASCTLMNKLNQSCSIFMFLVAKVQLVMAIKKLKSPY